MKDLKLTESLIELTICQNLNSEYEVFQLLNKARNNIMPLLHNNKHLFQLAFYNVNFLDSIGNEYRHEKFVEEIEKKLKNLPAVISNSLINSGINNVKWTNIKDLPNGQSSDVIKLGDAIFGYFNLDKNSDIYTIACLKDNDLLNTNLELNSVLGFLEKNAYSPHNDVLTINFYPSIDNYKPKVKIYHTKSMAYLAVFEPEGFGFEGKYIYAFKKTDKLDANKNLKINLKKSNIC